MTEPDEYWRDLRDLRVEVKQSLNPEAGTGLFAKTSFKTGETVATISGPVVPVASLAPLEVRYAVRVTNELCVNPLVDGVRTLGHHANDPLRDPLGRTENVRFSVYHGSKSKKIVTLKALRPIAVGEEILVYYGDDRRRMLEEDAKESRAESERKRGAESTSLPKRPRVIEDSYDDATFVVTPYVHNERYPFGVPAAVIDLTLGADENSQMAPSEESSRFVDLTLEDDEDDVKPGMSAELQSTTESDDNEDD